MAAKKPRSADRHKPGRNIRLRERLARQLAQLAERDASNLSEMTNRAVLEFLKREGVWPPPDSHS